MRFVGIFGMVEWRLGFPRRRRGRVEGDFAGSLGPSLRPALAGMLAGSRPLDEARPTCLAQPCGLSPDP